MEGTDFDQTRDLNELYSCYRLPSRTFYREELHNNRMENGNQQRLPYIVLKDVTGRRLDTFTQLQEAIYRARQNIKQTREALTADEWRLPHAPAPARPDYSRAAPPFTKLREKLRGDINHLSRTTKSTSTRIVEVDVDDVAFVAQSLQHLPNIPSLSFLRQDLLAEPKNYFQIVQTILLHKRFMKETDKREAIYNFPGFCSGCRKAGLCYGCEQSLIPHYHADKLMKTGGGFTYYKKYRPEHEVPGRHPLNWKIQFPELAFKSVMKGHENGELDLLEEKIEHDENCLLKDLLADNQLSFPKIHKESFLSTDALINRETEEKNEDEGIVADRKSLEDKLSKKDRRSAGMSGTSGQGSENSGQTFDIYQGDGVHGDGYEGDEYDYFQNENNSRLSHNRIVNLRQQEDEDLQSYDENFIKESIEKALRGARENFDQNDDEDTEGRDTDGRHDENKELSSEEGEDDSRSRSRTRSKVSSRHPLTASTKIRDENGSYSTKSSSPYSRKYDRLFQGKAYSPESSGSPGSKKRLYKAPPAFKIKKTERKKVKSSSPFSNNRDYNLDLGKKFELKKSDKKLTQFKEFQHKGGDWKAPEKFELKKTEREDVKFWKPPQKDKGIKKHGRSRRTNQHASPDSGLDSEKMTEMRQQGSGMTRLSLPTPSSGYRSQQTRSNRPRTKDSGLESRPMTREKTLLFQRKQFNKNNTTQESSVMESNSRAVSPKTLETTSLTDSWIMKDPNKKVRHGGIGVRQKNDVQTDDSDMKSEITQTTDLNSKTTGRTSEKLLKDSMKEETVKAPEMEERVITPSSQRISTPTDSPILLPMTPPSLKFTVGRGSSPQPIRTPSPIVEKPKKVIQKKQFIKREIEKKPPTPVVRSCTPQTPIPQEKEPETAIETPEIEEDTTPIKLPELVRLETPPLPEIIEKKKETVVKEDKRTTILPVPKLKETQKSPILKKKKVNMPKSTHKRSRSKQPAEAPVTKEEVQKMQDPLDFLAKYCIVSKDRLPFYERIYKNIIEGQPMRYDREPVLSPRTGMPIDKNDESNHHIGWEEHQLNMFHDLVTISRGHDVAKPGESMSEQYLEKICYTLEILDKKQKQITDDLHVLQSKKLEHIAEKAKQMIPEIARVQYQPKAAKKSKKKKKKKKEKNPDELEEEPPMIPLKPEDITNEVIAMRLDESTYKKICKKGEIPQIDLEMQRCAEKLAGIDDRLMELEGEKNLLTLYCMEVFFNEQNENHRPIEFRRQQSALYRHLHPDPDIEMNIEELEGALQVVNHNLISESEFDYLYQILNLPGRRKINFQLFTIIAALSEKISQMDPVIKKLLIKDNPDETKKKRRSYEALDLKMETSKELFNLLADGDYETNNNGNAKASSLAVELTAGGMDPEHVGYVISKFNRYGTGYIDFLDFVTYVPLFIEIHQKIVDDPFNVSLDV